MSQQSRGICRFLRSPIVIGFCALLLLPPMLSYALNKSFPYWGNPSYAFKLDFYLEHRQEFNTAAFGTSRTHAHFDSKTFDQELADEKISSFNLGVYGANHPELYFLYEKFLETDVSNIRYAIIELTGFAKIKDENRRANRTIYWLSVKDLVYIYAHIAAAQWEKSDKSRQKVYFLSGYLRKLYSIDRYAAEIKRYYEESRKGRREFLAGKDRDGFVPINDALPYDIAGDLDARRVNFENNTAQILEERLLSARNFTDLSEANLPLNRIHLEKIRHLIRVSSEKGVHVVFFVPPKAKNYREIIRLARLIPEEHFIEVVDPVKYPELYEYEYTFDKGHLNAEGAKIFSRYFAAAFKEKLQK